MTTKPVEVIKKEEFAIVVFDLNHEAFVIHITTSNVDSSNEVQLLKKSQIAHLKVDKTFNKFPSEYVDFADNFSSKLTAELLEHKKINDNTIKLVDNQQPAYGSIYSLRLMKLEILKA